MERKKRIIYRDKMREKYRQSKKSSILVYFVLRLAIIVCMVMQILRAEWGNAILCLLSLLLFTIPTFVEDKLKVTLPSALEAILYIFIFAAEILRRNKQFLQFNSILGYHITYT